MFKNLANFLGLRKRQSIFVRCCWDEEAGVWYVAESSIDGLAADAESIDQLLCKIRPMIADLIEDQRNDEGSSNDGAGSIPFDLLVNGGSRGQLHHC